MDFPELQNSRTELKLDLYKPWYFQFELHSNKSCGKYYCIFPVNCNSCTSFIFVFCWLVVMILLLYVMHLELMLFGALWTLMERSQNWRILTISCPSPRVTSSGFCCCCCCCLFVLENNIWWVHSPNFQSFIWKVLHDLFAISSFFFIQHFQFLNYCWGICVIIILFFYSILFME